MATLTVTNETALGELMIRLVQDSEYRQRFLDDAGYRIAELNAAGVRKARDPKRPDDEPGPLDKADDIRPVVDTERVTHLVIPQQLMTPQPGLYASTIGSYILSRCRG